MWEADQIYHLAFHLGAVYREKKLGNEKIVWEKFVILKRYKVKKDKYNNINI